MKMIIQTYIARFRSQGGMSCGPDRFGRATRVDAASATGQTSKPAVTREEIPDVERQRLHTELEI